MSEFSNHFRTRALSWAEAVEQHLSLSRMVAGAAAVIDEEGKSTDVPNVDATALEDVWNGLTKQLVPDGNGDIPTLADAVNLTMPVEYAPLMVIADGIVGVFALRCIDACLAGVDLSDDYEVRQRLPLAWKAFRKRKRQAANVDEGLGCDKSGGWLTLRDIEQVNMDAGFMKELERIAKLAGHMFDQLAPGHVMQPDHSPEELEGTTTGGQIERLTPTEQAKLGIPETEDMQAMRVLKKTAIETELAGQHPTAGGPLVLVLDESGSMSDRHGAKVAGRNSWAKACAVALTRIAHQGGREVRVVHFDSDTAVGELPSGDVRAMFEMARSFLGGGTNIGGALRCAADEVKALRAQGMGQADVVIATDGDDWDKAAISSHCSTLKALGAELWTVAIGHQHAVDHPLRTECKSYVFAEDSALNNEATATDLAGQFVGAALTDGRATDQDDDLN